MAIVVLPEWYEKLYHSATSAGGAVGFPLGSVDGVFDVARFVAADADRPVGAEIVRHGVDGFHWHTPDELVRFTRDLIADPAARAAMSASAQARAGDYSTEVFTTGLRAAAHALFIAPPAT